MRDLARLDRHAWQIDVEVEFRRQQELLLA
jgi:hypothetical protein